MRRRRRRRGKKENEHQLKYFLQLKFDYFQCKIKIKQMTNKIIKLRRKQTFAESISFLDFIF